MQKLLDICLGWKNIQGQKHLYFQGLQLVWKLSQLLKIKMRMDGPLNQQSSSSNSSGAMSSRIELLTILVCIFGSKSLSGYRINY